MAEEILLLKVASDFKQPIKDFDKLQKVIKAPVKNMGDLRNQTRALKKLFEQIKPASQQAFNDLVKDLSGAKKGTQQFNNVQDKLLATFAQTETLLADNRNEILAYNKAIRQGSSASDSYNALSNQLTQLNNQFRRLSKTEQQSKTGQQLIANINKIEGELKELDASVGKYGRKVGDYKNAVRDALAEYRSLPQIKSDLNASRQELTRLGAQQRETANATRQGGRAAEELANKYRKQGDEGLTAQQILQRELFETKGKLDQVTASVNNDVAAIKRLKGESTALGNVFKGFTGGVGFLSAVGLGSQAFQSLRQGISLYTDYGLQLDKLAAVSGASAAQQKALKDNIDALGASTKFTSVQVAEANIEFAKLGFNPEQILASTDSLLKFSISVDRGINQTAPVAASTLRGFGLEIEDIGRVTDVLSKAFNSSGLDLEKFKNAMTPVAPVASALGFSLENTTAILGKLVDAGFDASSAGTATRNILLNLADTNGKLAKSLGQPIKSLDDLVPALTQLDAKGIDVAEALELTDKRSVAAFLNFTKNAESVGDLSESLENAKGTAEATADVIGDNLKGDIDKLVSAIQGNALKAFAEADGGLRGIVKGATALVNGLANLTGFLFDNRKVILAILVAYALLRASYIKNAVLQRANIALTKIDLGLTRALRVGKLALAVAYNTVSGNAAKAAKAQKVLNVAMRANPIGLIVSGIALLIPLLSSFQAKAANSAKAAKELSERTVKLAESNRVLTKEAAKKVKQLGEEEVTAKSLLNQLKLNLNAQNQDEENRKERVRLVNEFNSQFGKYAGNLNTEKVALEDLAKAEKILNAEILKRQIYIAFQDEITELVKQETDARKALIRVQTEQTNIDNKRAGTNIADSEVLEANKKLIEQAKKLNEGIINESQNAQKEVTTTYDKLAESVGTTLGKLQKLFGETELETSVSINSKGENGKTENEIDFISGSLADLDRQLQDAQKLLNNFVGEGDEPKIIEIQAKIIDLESQRKVLEDTINVAKLKAVDRFNEPLEILPELKPIPQSAIDSIVEGITADNNIIFNLELQDEAFLRQVSLLATEASPLLQQLSGSLQGLSVDEQTIKIKEFNNQIKLNIEQTRNELSNVTGNTFEDIELRTQLAQQLAFLEAQLRIAEQAAILNSTETTKQQKIDAALEVSQILRDLAKTDADYQIEQEKRLARTKQQLINEGFIKQRETAFGTFTQILDKDKLTAEQRKEINVENAKQALGAISDIAGQISSAVLEFQQASLDAEFDQRFDKLDQQRERELQQAGDNEAAKEQINKKFDAEREKIEREKFEKDKQLKIKQAIINGALAATTALAQSGLAGLATIPIIATTVALQIAAIEKQEFEDGGLIDIVADYNKAIQEKSFIKAKKGAYLKYGKRHSNGGIKARNRNTGRVEAEFEQGESIQNRQSTQKYYQQLSWMNEDGGGVKFPGASSLSSQHGQRFINSIKTFQNGGVLSVPRVAMPQPISLPKFVQGGFFTESSSNATELTLLKKQIDATNNVVRSNQAIFSELRRYHVVDEGRTSEAEDLKEQSQTGNQHI